MFKKISIGKTRAARRVVFVFTEDLDRKDHTGVPVELRAAFIRGISNPGFHAETGETAFVDDLLLLGLGSQESVDADAARAAEARLVATLSRSGVDAIEFASRADGDDLPRRGRK